MISSSNPVVAFSRPKLSPAQAQGAVLIALGRRQREVAKILDVAHETVCRWGHLPEFESTVFRIQEELIESTRARHLALIEEAMNELGQLVRHPSPVIRLRAIGLILQPLRMPDVSLKECRAEPNDEVDFQDFMRAFTEEARSRELVAKSRVKGD